MNTKHVNIEEELTILWQRVYNGIVDIVKNNNMVNTPIEINTDYIKSLTVDNSGSISITTLTGDNDFLENYEDAVIYKIYEILASEDCHEVASL